MAETEEAGASAGRGQSISDQQFRNLLEKRFTVKSGKSDYLSLFRSLARGVQISKSKAREELVNIGHFMLTNSARFTRLLGNDDHSFNAELRKFLPTNQEPGGLFTVQVASIYYERTIVLIRPAFRIQRFGTEFSSDRPIYLSLHDDGRFSFLKPKDPDPLANPLPSIQQSPPPPPARQNLKSASSSSPTPASSSSPSSNKRKATDSSGPSNKKTKSTSTRHVTSTAVTCERDPSHVVKIKRSNECGQGIESNSKQGRQQENETHEDPRVEHNQAIIKEMKKEGPMNRKKKRYPPKPKKNRFFKCLLCGKFLKYSSINDHINYACPQNTQKLDRVVTKRQKKTTDETVKESFKCEKCGNSFSSKRSLMRHLYSVKGICQLTAENRKIKEEYMEEIHDQEKGGKIRYKCRECGHVYANTHSFIIHIRSGACRARKEKRSGASKKKTSTKIEAESMEVEQVEGTEDGEQGHAKDITVNTRFQCERCGTGFSRKYILQRHQNSKSDICDRYKVNIEIDKKAKKVYVYESGRRVLKIGCRDCNRTYCSMTNFRCHIKNNACISKDETNARVDAKEEKKQESGKSYKCVKCGTEFTMYTHLKQHQNSPANVCSRIIEKRQILEEHAEIMYEGVNEEIMMYKCRKCNTVYKNVNNFVSHIHNRTCKGMDKWKSLEPGVDTKAQNGLTCATCGTTFSNQWYYNNHRVERKQACEATLNRKRFLEEYVQEIPSENLKSKLSYQCKKCDVIYSSIVSLQEHVAKGRCKVAPSRGKNPMLYTWKEKTFSSYKAYRDHVNAENHNIKFSHDDNAPVVQCLLCLRPFNSDDALQYHFRKYCLHNVRKTVQCTVCTSRLKSLDAFIEHVKTKHETKGEEQEEERQCPQCFGLFSTLNFLDHLFNGLCTKKPVPKCPSCRIEINNDSSVIKFQDDDSGHCSCAKCEFQFSVIQTSQLDHYFGLEENRTPYNCDVCGESFCTETSLKLHYCPRMHTCDHCESYFGSPEGLRRHKCPNHPKNHTIFSCVFCAKEFEYQCELDMHIRWHTHESDVSCGVCGKMFRSDENLYKHKLINHGSRKCDLCGKDNLPNAYMCKEVLYHSKNCHQRLCIGELDYKPYQRVTCNECKKQCYAFDYHRHLQHHILMSMKMIKSRPFPCPKCNCAFTLKKDLLLHDHIHLAVDHVKRKAENLKCDHCGRIFGTPHGLKIHSYYCKYKDKTSGNEEASKKITAQFEPNIYQCCQCLETTDCRDQMMEHFSKVHGVQVPKDFNDVRARIKIELTNDGPYSCFVCEQRYSCRVFQRMHTRICQDRFGEKISNSKPTQLLQPPQPPISLPSCCVQLERLTSQEIQHLLHNNN